MSFYSHPLARTSYFFLLVLICGIGYRGLVDQPWSYDDLEHIQHAARTQNDFLLLFSPSAKEPNRWLLNSYFHLLFPFLGDDPSGYHTLNILLHALNSYLCARLILLFAGEIRTAALAGVLFALSSAAYEAVYEVSAAGVLLGVGLMLVSLINGTIHLQSGSTRALVLSVLSFAGGLLCYETLACFLIPVLALSFHEPRRPDQRWRALPIALSLVVLGLILLDLAGYQTAESKTEFNKIAVGPHLFYNALFFVGRLFLNAHMTPLVWDGPAPFDVSPRDFDLYALSGGFLLLITLLFIRRSWYVRFFAIWILGTITPYIWGTAEFYFPRHWYPASVGGAAVLAYALVQIRNRIPGPKILRSMLLPVLLLPIALGSFHKMRHYEGRFLLHAANFHLTHRQDPESALLYYERVRKDYRVDHAMLYTNMGAALLKTGSFHEAQLELEKAIQIDPENAPALRNLSIALDRQGELRSAVETFIQAAEIQRDYLADLFGLGVDLCRAGKWTEARTVHEALVRLAPDSDAQRELEALLQGKSD